MPETRRRVLLRIAVIRRGDKIRPGEVFVRDGWRCWICQKHVDRTKKAPHPNSPTVDHVVPIYKGGTHSWGNVRCAHFGCNSYRGDRSWCQLRLDFD